MSILKKNSKSPATDIEDYVVRLADNLKHLVGAKVNIVSFSYQVDIGFISDAPQYIGKPELSRYWGFQFEETFELMSGGKTYTINAREPEPAAIVELVKLVRAKFTATELIDSRHLEITFENGAKLVTDPTFIDKTWTFS
jgi:hypothetical protein